MNKHFFSDMGVMLGPSMRHIFRSIDTIITVTIMPIAFMLLFVYVFGGAIQTGTDNYVTTPQPQKRRGFRGLKPIRGNRWTLERP